MVNCACANANRPRVFEMESRSRRRDALSLKRKKANTRKESSPCMAFGKATLTDSDSESQEAQQSTPSRISAMVKYMKLAKHGKKKDDVRISSRETNKAVLIPVGRMIYSNKVQRGTMDRSFVSVKGCFYKDMTHCEVLRKCIYYGWGSSEVTESAQEYYLSDSSGSKICAEDLTLRYEDGDSTVPWTLGDYMLAFNMYASKTRLYSVRVGATIGDQGNVSILTSAKTKCRLMKRCDATSIINSLSKPNEFLVLDVIGKGSFGTVSRGVWRGSVVAGKEISTAGNSRILDNELSVYRTLHHPNLLALLGTVTTSHSLILVTNYVNGRNLHSCIFGTGKKLVYEEKVLVCRQMLQAIVFMHTAVPPVAHLDLKPENILVEDDRLHVYVADFGLGKILCDSRVLGTATKIAGTPGFQAPEKLKGEKITTAMDIYSLGGVLTELFSGKPLYTSMDAHTIMCRVVLQNILPDFDHLEEQIHCIVKQCLCPVEQRSNATHILEIILKL